MHPQFFTAHFRKDKLTPKLKISFSNRGPNPKEHRFTLFPPKLKESQVLPCPFTDNRPTVTPT